MRQKRYIKNKKGVVLVIVLLLLVAITMIALVAMRIGRAENGFARAMQYNRQAAKSTLGASIYLQREFSKTGHNIVQNSKQDALSEQIKNMGNYAQQLKDWKNTFDGGMLLGYYPDEITVLSGMGPSISDTNGRLLGDLTKPTKQAAMVNNLTLSTMEVAGFSKGGSFCTASAYGNSAAVFGVVPVIDYTVDVQIDENGDQVNVNKPNRSHYLLAEVNSSVAGFKREMGTLDLGTVPCN